MTFLPCCEGHHRLAGEQGGRGPCTRRPWLAKAPLPFVTSPECASKLRVLREVFILLRRLLLGLTLAHRVPRRSQRVFEVHSLFVLPLGVGLRFLHFGVGPSSKATSLNF